MYYCFCCPPPSFIVIAFYAFLFHEFSCPVFSVRQLAQIKVTSVLIFGAVRLTASQCVHIVVVVPGNVAPLIADAHFFF